MEKDIFEMKSRNLISILAFLFTFSTSLSHAQDKHPSLLFLSDLIQMTDTNYPKLINKKLEVDIAEDNIFSSKGVFDLNLDIETYKKWGYYNHEILNVQISQYLPIWGAQILSGWRYGNGDFATYDQFLETKSDGEFFGSLKIPILKNGTFDKNRFELKEKQIEYEYAKSLFSTHRLRTHNSVSKLYWKWLAKNQIVKIYQELLSLALKRDAALKVQVDKGDKAQIHLLDNKLAIQSRQAMLISAKRDLASINQKLEMFFNGFGDNALGYLTKKAAPNYPPPFSLTWQDTKWIENHPELKILNLKRQLLQNEIRLEKNQILPKLDLKLSVEKDVGQTTNTLQDEEFKTGLIFSFPLQNRKSRGKLSAQKIKSQKVDNKITFLKTSFTTNSKMIHKNLDFAKQEIDFQKQSVNTSYELQKAEETKFENGMSDLLILNIREEKLAKSKVDLINAYEVYFNLFSDALLIHGESPLDYSQLR